MLKKELQQFLSDTIGVDIEVLKTAITSEDEVEVPFKSGTLLDEAALNGLKETVKKEGYNEGKITGVEMEAKRVKEKFGIDIEGKNFDNIFTTFQEQTLTNAKIEPDKKVKELSASLESLRGKLENDLGLKDKEIESLHSEIGNYKINGELARHLPDGLTGIKPNQFSVLAKTELNFGFDDGVFVAKKGDKILKDNLEKPLSVKEVLSDYARNNGWIETNGRAGSDDTGTGQGKFKSMNELMKYMDENRIDPLKPDGAKLIAEFQQSNK